MVCVVFVYSYVEYGGERERTTATHRKRTSEDVPMVVCWIACHNNLADYYILFIVLQQFIRPTGLVIIKFIYYLTKLVWVISRSIWRETWRSRSSRRMKCLNGRCCSAHTVMRAGAWMP